MSQAVNINRRLAALTASGTSPWLDQIRRSLTQGGELRRPQVTDDGRVDQHVQRLGGQRAERGDGQPEDLAVMRRAEHRP